MGRLLLLISCCITLTALGLGQSASFQTYMNPVIPGDHPDCTVTKIGNDFYTTGSSFNPTPVIYHSTDLVHWEAIAQPVTASWSGYGDSPSGGCWGGQVVYHGNKYWDFFSRANTMYFVTADDIRGPWSLPTTMVCPPSVPGLGYDNSIFIDDDGSWYLLVKNGQVNNWIVQLGENGQPSGAVHNLCWINPAPSYPYSWAEGPVMWKYRGNYYYSFARDVAGGQKVFRSPLLTGDQASWTVLGDFFNLNDPLRFQALFQNPNHSSAAVMLGDSTSWVIHPLWRSANANEWYGQGRQGLLNQVQYDANGVPIADYPINSPKAAPQLPSSGIPWMVPHADFFDSTKLNSEWSFLGYTPANSYSLTQRSGWLRLSPKGKLNTIIKNDSEHNYSLITRLDFQPATVSDQAGIWVFNGLQTLDARLYSSVDSAGNRIVGFNYKTTHYQVSDPAPGGETIVWLKLVRAEHSLTGYCSADGRHWIGVGSSISVADMENEQPNWNAWTGNRQGLFVQGKSADFDFYIYRDAYTPILAECPANQYGTTVSATRSAQRYLDNIHDNDWAMYAGVELGGDTDYQKSADSLAISASCASAGGVLEVWLDSLDTGTKIADCPVSNTGSSSTFQEFKTNVVSSVSGMHDMYIRFRSAGSSAPFALYSITFLNASMRETGVGDLHPGESPARFELMQNYPNPFNPKTVVRSQTPEVSNVRIVIYDLLGRVVKVLINEPRPAGSYEDTFDGSGLASGAYICRMTAGAFVQTRAMMLVK